MFECTSNMQMRIKRFSYGKNLKKYYKWWPKCLIIQLVQLVDNISEQHWIANVWDNFNLSKPKQIAELIWKFINNYYMHKWWTNVKDKHKSENKLKYNLNWMIRKSALHSKQTQLSWQFKVTLLFCFVAMNYFWIKWAR